MSHFKNLAQTLTDSGKNPYKFVCKIEKCLQPDSYQCGPWLLYFLEERLKNPDINFNELDAKQSQKMIANYRVEMMNNPERIYHLRERSYSSSGPVWYCLNSAVRI